jgi:hypothetical protein
MTAARMRPVSRRAAHPRRPPRCPREVPPSEHRLAVCASPRPESPRPLGVSWWSRYCAARHVGPAELCANPRPRETCCMSIARARAHSTGGAW